MADYEEPTNRHDWFRDSNGLFRYARFSGNENRIINSPEYITQYLFPFISKTLKRQVTAFERKFITDELKMVNPDIFRGKTLNESTTALVGFFVEKLTAYTCDADDEKINAHELLKDIMGTSGEAIPDSTGRVVSKEPIAKEIAKSVEVNGILGQNTIYKIQKLLNHDALDRYTYLPLDSKYRILENDGTSFYSWNHVNSLTQVIGSVNTIGETRDIIQMEVAPIKIPYVANAINELGRVTMLIEEFKGQSHVGHENRRYHFMFAPTINGGFIDLDPKPFHKGKYEFNTPITQLDTITVTFGSPLQKIIFDRDRSLAFVTYSNPTVITTTTPHNLTTGNTVNFTSFTTRPPSVSLFSSLISTINSDTTIAVVVLSPTTFTVAINTTPVRRNTLSGSITATNGSAAIVGVGTLFLAEIPAPPTTVIFAGNTDRYPVSVAAVIDNLNLTLSAPFAGPTTSGMTILYPFGGTLSVVNGSTTITGVGTAFIIDFKVNGIITLVTSAGAILDYAITAIASNTSMTIGAPYAGITEALRPYYSDAAMPAPFNIVTYYNSKRTLIQLKLKFILPE